MKLKIIPSVAHSHSRQEDADVLGDVLLVGVVSDARAGRGQVELVQVVGQVAPWVDWAAVAGRPPGLVRRPQPQRRAMEATAHARAPVAGVLVALTETWGDALSCVGVGHQVILLVLDLLLLLLLQPVDVVQQQHLIFLEEGMMTRSRS